MEVKMWRAVGNPMLQKEIQLDGVVKLDEFDLNRDVSDFVAQIREYQSQLDDYEKLLKENDMDVDLRAYLLLASSNREIVVVPDKKRQEQDGASQSSDNCYGEEENDPEYEDFLKCLTEHGKSYVLEDEENGLIKYEEEVHCDEECDPEPRRKLRSSKKQNVECSDQMPGRENQGNRDPQSIEPKKLTRRILRSKTFNHNVENGKCAAKETVAASDCHTSSQTAHVVDEGNASTYRTKLRSAMKQDIGSSNSMPGLGNQCKHDLRSPNETKDLNGKSRNMAMSGEVQIVKWNTELVPDNNYFVFLQSIVGIKDVDGGYDGFVFTCEGHRIVYEIEDGKHNQVEENHDDDFSDVQNIDRASFYNTVNKHKILDICPAISDFKQQLINVLKKPYDKEEHRRLWQDIRRRKPQERHLDLRNGRERNYAKRIDGKSYLDYEKTDLKVELSKCKNDKPKHLNLLRGYFFWLENCPSESSFTPWTDPECLLIRPGKSC